MIAADASVTGVNSVPGCGVQALGTPLLSNVVFQTVFDRLPVRAADRRSPSDAATTAAPARASGSVSLSFASSAVCHAPRAPVFASGVRT